MRGTRKTFKASDDMLIRQQPVTGISLKRLATILRTTQSPLGIERENSVFRLLLAMCAEGISTREPCAALTDWLTRYWNGSRTTRKIKPKS